MKSLYTSNISLIKDRPFTYLALDAASGISTISVQSINAFSTNQILVIGEIGQEESEIKYTAVTSPVGSTLYLSAGLTFSHPQDTKIYIIPWDQVEFSRAATATGAKTTLTAGLTIEVDKQETLWDDFTYTSGFYFSRYKDTLNTRYSDYSDPIPYAGYSDNMVFSIKDRALDAIGEKISDLISHSFLNSALYDARREYHNSPGKRPFRKKLNQDIGNVSSIGMYRIEVPTDLEKPSTAENIYKVQIGTERPLAYVDKKEIDEVYRNIPHTTIKNLYSTADVYLVVDDARDLANSGSVLIETDTVAYSAKDVSTGSLTVSTAGLGTHAVGINIWQNTQFSLPTRFTVIKDSGGTNYITFDYPISTMYLNQNIWADYYKTITTVDSDADELDEPSYDFYVNYLSWRIKKKKNNGLIATTDDDFLLWRSGLQTALNNEYLGTDISFIPDIDHLS